MLQKHGKQLMGWEEIMTKDMSKEAIIHSWRGAHEGMKPGESLINAVKNGYKTVLSNGYYIDLMFSVDSHYLNDPMPKGVSLTDVEKARILGGEATMWTELATPTTIDSRIWPRTVAIAERLWSAEDITDLESMHKRLAVVSVKLEELGLTHLKNRDVLFRNISNNQPSDALKDFANVCEPLKGYTRNKGGTEYQMYSPLTLFADVCIPDAIDAVAFAKVVDAYLADKNDSNKAKVEQYLNKWSSLYEQLNVLGENAPLVQPVLPLAKNLSETSKQLLLKLEGKKVDSSVLSSLVEKCNTKEYADVELAVYSSFKKLI